MKTFIWNACSYYSFFVNLLSFYALQIKAFSSVAAHMLHELEGVKKTSSTEPTLILVDIAGYAVFFLCLYMASVIKTIG